MADLAFIYADEEKYITSVKYDGDAFSSHKKYKGLSACKKLPVYYCQT